MLRAAQVGTLGLIQAKTMAAVAEEEAAAEAEGSSLLPTRAPTPTLAQWQRWVAEEEAAAQAE